MKMEFLTAEEAAEYLRLNIDTVRKLLRKGTIPGVKIGRQWRIPKRALEAWREAEQNEEAAHRARFEKAVSEYRAAQGIEPDRNWRALLYLCTSTPNLWAHVRPHLDFRSGTAKLDAVQAGALSSGERALFELARALFAGEGLVDITALLSLSGSFAQIAFDAVQAYQSGLQN